jgi:hypothetical protein
LRASCTGITGAGLAHLAGIHTLLMGGVQSSHHQNRSLALSAAG